MCEQPSNHSFVFNHDDGMGTWHKVLDAWSSLHPPPCQCDGDEAPMCSSTIPQRHAFSEKIPGSSYSQQWSITVGCPLVRCSLRSLRVLLLAPLPGMWRRRPRLQRLTRPTGFLFCRLRRLGLALGRLPWSGVGLVLWSSGTELPIAIERHFVIRMESSFPCDNVSWTYPHKTTQKSISCPGRLDQWQRRQGQIEEEKEEKRRGEGGQ